MIVRKMMKMKVAKVIKFSLFSSFALLFFYVDEFKYWHFVYIKMINTPKKSRFKTLYSNELTSDSFFSN